MNDPSQFEIERIKAIIPIPNLLKELGKLEAKSKPSSKISSEKLTSLFPHTIDSPVIEFEKNAIQKKGRPLRVGVVFSGGQASGGHNVIAGLFDGLKQIDKESILIGFLGGPSGILEGNYREISGEHIALYRNTGGFDLLGSGRTKIETLEQLEFSLKTMQKLGLDGLVVIGGDDSNTNAAILGEYFKAKKCSTCVVGVPKTIDCDLKGQGIEVSFGFDTACKTYSEIIGNIARDTISAKKYYHFIRLMGRSASHIALECALQTRPNFTFIGEEVATEKKSLQLITEELADLICKRAAAKKNYGVILIPEGVIEFIPEIKQLIKEINLILTGKPQNHVIAHLSPEARATFSYLPEKVQHQLLLERDPHGNVQVSQIATDELLIHTVRKELLKRTDYKEKFFPINHFLGYEGRAAFPTPFDSAYCMALGLNAALLIWDGYSGYMSVISNLTAPIIDWKPMGIPIVSMMTFEERKGKEKAVIAKALVDLEGEAFALFASKRKAWEMDDHYLYPGPTQFSGPLSYPQTLLLEHLVEGLKGRVRK